MLMNHATSHISIHPPHAGRDVAAGLWCRRCGISIHPPHAGRDLCWPPFCLVGGQFQSTLPMRGGTYVNGGCKDAHGFQSTLPMRGGTDDVRTADGRRAISIHPPHAGRDTDADNIRFDSKISIHPPHAGRDLADLCPAEGFLYFNPPSPCGEGQLPDKRYQ